MDNQSRKIGLLGALAIIIGTVIGASIYMLLGPIAAQTGPSLFLAYGLAFLPAFFGSFYYAQLGSAMPSTGGSYFYSKKLISPVIGYINAISLILAGIGATVMLSIGFAEYAVFFFPGVNKTFVVISVILVLYIINVLGVKTSEIVQILLTLWVVLGLIMFAVPGIFQIDASNLTPMFPNGFGNFISGTALAVYSYVGIGVISEIGENIKNPSKNLPRAIFIGMFFVAIIYMFVTFVSVGVLPWEVLADSGASVAEAAQTFLPNSVLIFISFGALFGSITTINALLLTIPGDFVALSKEGIFSKKFQISFNDAPFLPLTFMTILAIIGALTPLSVDYFSTITIVGLLLNIVILGIASWHLEEKYYDAYKQAPFKIKKPLLRALIIIGVPLNIVFILISFMDYPSIGIMFILWIGGGIALHYNKVKQLNIKQGKEKNNERITD